MPDNINASSSVISEIDFYFCASFITPSITREDIEACHVKYFHREICDSSQRALDSIANALYPGHTTSSAMNSPTRSPRHGPPQSP